MTTYPFIIIVTILLIILWFYSAVSKLKDMAKFKTAMLRQIFPQWIDKLLVYTLPPVEIAVAILLLFESTRLYGMYSSLVLILAFTIYVGGAVFGFYPQYPCSCGGIFTKMGWPQHFRANVALTLLALAGVLLMVL